MLKTRGVKVGVSGRKFVHLLVHVIGPRLSYTINTNVRTSVVVLAHKSGGQRMIGWYINMYRCQIDTFFRSKRLLFSSDRWSWLELLAAGLAGSPREHTPQVWTPAEVDGACSGGPKSRNPASNYGICFRRARACQDNANPSI